MYVCKYYNLAKPRTDLEKVNFCGLRETAQYIL